MFVPKKEKRKMWTCTFGFLSTNGICTLSTANKYSQLFHFIQIISKYTFE